MKKLKAFAEFLRGELPGLANYSSGDTKSNLTKFQYPKKYTDLVKLCIEYYRTDPLVSNTINKIIDIGLKGFYLGRGKCTDEEYLVYSSVDDLVVENLKELLLEYLLSGLVVPEATWDRVQGKKIDSSLSKSYFVPEVLWKRPPLSLELQTTPIPNRVNVYVVISNEDADFIKNEGKYADGTEDKETYQLLAEEYPDFIAAVKAGKTKFKLENPHLIRRKPLDDSPYPTPYLLPALERLEHKRNLQKMDYAIAARVITAILLFRLGNDEHPLTEDDEDQILDLKTQLLWRGQGGNPERLYQLFANHTLQVDWITPDVDALLNEEKYDSVNEDILFALGFPRILLTGETIRTGTSSPEFAMVAAAEGIKAAREAIMSWPKALYKEMKDRNNFIALPEPEFEELRLYDIEKIISISDTLYQRGAIAKSTLARLGGFDYINVELPVRIKEQELMEKADIPEFPLMPFTAPAQEPPSEKPDEEKPDEEDKDGKENDTD